MWKEWLVLLLGVVVLLVGADVMIRGARNIARALGISPLVIGLTVVAFGTSAPELFVSLAAAFQGNADVAVGNVIGSNTFNILVIIGLSCMVSKISIGSAVRWREMPIMIAVMLAFVLVSWDLVITRVEGMFLFCGILAYLFMNYRLVVGGKVKVEDVIEDIDELDQVSTNYMRNFGFVIAGLAGLIYGAELVVNQATFLARYFGISELVIGVTLVAAGTSLPELATTVLAALKGEPDLAVGNAIGSNIFNALCVIGATATVQPLTVNPQALAFDLPYMFFACLLVWPLMIWRRDLSRPEGGLMLAGYVSYIYLIVA